MKHTKVKALTDGAICTALTAVFLLIARYVPPLTLLLAAVSGTPLIYLGVRHGMRIAALAFGAGILLLFILTGDPLSAALLGVMHLLPGLVIGYGLSRRAGFKTILAAAAGAVLFGLMVQILLINASGDGHGIEQLVNATLDTTREMVTPILEGVANSGTAPNTDLMAVFQAVLSQVREMIFLYIPAFVIGLSAVLGYAVFMMGIYILARLRVCQVRYIPLNRFYAPRPLCYTAVVLFLVASFSHDTTVYTAALKNLTALLNGYFAVCGLAVLDYKFSEKLPSGYARAAIYGAAVLAGYVLMGFLIQILIFLGLLDGLFNFRRLQKAGGSRG